MRKNIGFGLVVLLALYVMLASPFSPGLGAQGHTMMGGVLIAIGIWVLKPFALPYSVGGLFLAAFGLIAGLRPGLVFSGFAEPAVWTLVPALFFGTVLRKTGLGKNMAFGIMRLFRPSYPSLICAWVCIGVVLSIFTPSMTVRVAIMIPIAMQCCELCQLKKGSRGQSLIMLTAFAMALLPGSGWLTGVLWGPIVQGVYDGVPQMTGLITFDSWLSVMLIPQLGVSALLVLVSYFVLKPQETISPEVFASLIKEKIVFSGDEKKAGVILLASFALFITSGLHGIPTAAICLGAVVLFFLFRILGPDDIGGGISWDMVLYTGMALGINSIFSTTGISAWLSGIIVPAIGPVAGNPLIFALVMLLILFAWRFFDIAMFIPTMAVLIPVLPSIQEAYGISPLLWLPLFIMAANCFFMNYQNMWAVMGTSLAGDRSWTPRHLGTYGIIYFISCAVLIALMVPLWLRMGLI
ncbi:MAG: anion permease [Treponema sp.]|nr:anion permease [Treponema sp.]